MATDEHDEATDDYETRVGAEIQKKPRLKQTLDAFRAHGPMTDKQLEATLPTSEWRTRDGQPFKAAGMEVRTLRRRLSAIGLIEPAGKTKDTGAGIYRATATGRVEAAALRFASLSKAARKPTRGQTPAAKLAELRKLSPGDWSHFNRVRKMILQVGPALESVQTMAFWTVADDDLELIQREIEDLVEWGHLALDAIRTRQEDDATRRKIEKLLDPNTAGRTEHEIAAARRRADKLRERLP
jgi:hypothetical protein